MAIATSQVTVSSRLAVVADDDGQMRSLVAMVLREVGFSVLELSDGLALVDYLRSSASPALLVTDLQMPGFTGLQAIRYVRRLGLELPIILTTAFGNPRVHTEAIRLGASAVLDKPFSLSTLRALATSFFAPSEEPSGVRGQRP